ncbi:MULTISPECIES: gliding motility-associated C-terminal domain-containing protein [Niastella]|uniref:Gliding motility-associated C-terminal domain-containing protein n=1 Tax=Niastella soli TaxID=2821487 RepID=A0ABS3YVJ0_9BACT|nr:gliding motility-associated C-terminal domain-containing protein [Niastella soli]MBO9201893.1 gliding motility-associated C-terminal domain-containing protein [Niastella soli]
MCKARSVACCLFIFLCFLSNAYSQSSCPPNLDFEKGNFDGWECFTGYVDTTFDGKNRMNLTLSQPENNRHTIISSFNNPGKDQYGGFPKLCPYGGNYSVQLGNDINGAQAEAISYTFEVPNTVDTFTFTYFYAVVLEDPNHEYQAQPRFFVTAYDVVTGSLINCASFDYVSTARLPGFTVSKKSSPGGERVIYKGWTPTSLQFAGMGGHLVRLEFRTADCTYKGHFGYAYLDVASACSNILATAPYCIETNSLILDAPFGFQYYTWYSSDYKQIIGHGQSMTLSPPPVTTGVFYVDVEPYPGFGCRDTLQAYVQPYPVPDTPDAVTTVNLCQHEIAEPLVASVLPGHQLMWYTTPTGGIPTSDAPVPATTVPGTVKYYVSQKALYGCEGFRREITVNVSETPNTSFLINNYRQCVVGNNYIFTNTTTNLVNPVYTWDFDDGNTDTTLNTLTNYRFTVGGVYKVKLKATNTTQFRSCSKEESNQVTVIPKPTAAFVYPDPICENQTFITLTDRSSILPIYATGIATWWWNINGKITTGKTPTSFLAPPGGTFPIRLAVSTYEGCRSDTTSNLIYVRFKPLPEFNYGDLMCNNETIWFRDQSQMPAGSAGEVVSKWNWTVDNSYTVDPQNPTLHFNAGMHKVQLVSENNFGCQSPPVEHSFEIYPKATIKMEMSDSCVYLPINFTAIDVAGNVANWTWNWDKWSFQQRGPRITKTFFNNGNWTLTLIGYTDKGCKDTVIRPITIFENASEPGKDTTAPYNEPIELDAHGEPNMKYTWSPLSGLDRGDVEKPIAILGHDQVYQLYTVTDKGCKKQTDILVKRYAGPELFVPTAFTPNNDGKNDLFKVIPTGLRTFGFLAIYNRWGQLVFRTTDYNKGWDGTFNGAKADAGSFVYIVQAIDYKGRPMNRKGTFILIR